MWQSCSFATHTDLLHLCSDLSKTVRNLKCYDVLCDQWNKTELWIWINPVRRKENTRNWRGHVMFRKKENTTAIVLVVVTTPFQIWNRMNRIRILVGWQHTTTNSQNICAFTLVHLHNGYVISSELISIEQSPWNPCHFLVKKCTAFYNTRTLIVAFKRTQLLSLSRASSIQFTPSDPISFKI